MPVKQRLNRLIRFGILLATGLACACCMGQAAGPVEDQRQAAFTLEQQGNNAEAETAWRALLKLQPANPEPYAHLGFLEARQEHYKEAAPLYRKALALNPAMPGLRLNLGLALFKAGELKEAIRIFEPMLKSQPASSAEAERLTILVGMAHYGLGEFAAAVPYLKQATARDAQSLPYRLVLAHSCLAAKQFQCVLDVYHEILTLNAESAESDMLAGEALDEMRDHAGATLQFRAAVKANPREPNVHFGLGYLLWSQSQYDEAAHEFAAELDNDPGNVQALAYLADSDMKLEHPDAAQPLIEKAIRMDAGRGASGMELAHLDLGMLYSDADRKDDALREFKIAARLSPDDVNVHWRLARLYQSMGKKDEATAEFQKTKSLHKTSEETLFKRLDNSHAPTAGATTEK